MKKLVAVACLTLLGTGAYAQTTRGTMVLSGAVSGSGQTHERNDYDGSSLSLSIFPSTGYFYKEGLEVGLSTNFSFGKNKYAYDEGEAAFKSYHVGAGPYIRKYIPLLEKLYLTASGGVGIGFGTTLSKAPNESSFSKDSNSFTASLSAAPGLTYFATEKLGLFINVGHLNLSRSTSKSEKTDTRNTTTYFSADVSPSSSSIGFRYFINR